MGFCPGQSTKQPFADQCDACRRRSVLVVEEATLSDLNLQSPEVAWRRDLIVERGVLSLRHSRVRLALKKDRRFLTDRPKGQRARVTAAACTPGNALTRRSNSSIHWFTEGLGSRGPSDMVTTFRRCKSEIRAPEVHEAPYNEAR